MIKIKIINQSTWACKEGPVAPLEVLQEAKMAVVYSDYCPRRRRYYKKNVRLLSSHEDGGDLGVFSMRGLVRPNEGLFRLPDHLFLDDGTAPGRGYTEEA